MRVIKQVPMRESIEILSNVAEHLDVDKITPADMARSLSKSARAVSKERRKVRFDTAALIPAIIRRDDGIYPPVNVSILASISSSNATIEGAKNAARNSKIAAGNDVSSRTEVNKLRQRYENVLTNIIIRKSRLNTVENLNSAIISQLSSVDAEYNQLLRKRTAITRFPSKPDVTGGITVHSQELIYVLDSFDNMIYAYNKGSGSRSAVNNIDLTVQSIQAEGIWTDGIIMYVSSRITINILAYDLITGLRRPDDDFNTLNFAGNTDPRGIWSNGTIMWVVDNTDNKIYAFNLATKARVPSQDFNTLDLAGNTNPRGIWSDGIKMWVVDLTARKVFVYDVATKARIPLLEFNFSLLNTVPIGIVIYGGKIYISDTIADKVFAYTQEGTYISDSDIVTLKVASNTSPRGMTLSASIIYVMNITQQKVYAYSHVTGARIPAKDIDVRGVIKPWGVATIGNFMYVTSSAIGHRTIYVFNLTTGREDVSKRITNISTGSSSNNRRSRFNGIASFNRFAKNLLIIDDKNNIVINLRIDQTSRPPAITSIGTHANDISFLGLNVNYVSSLEHLIKHITRNETLISYNENLDINGFSYFSSDNSRISPYYLGAKTGTKLLGYDLQSNPAPSTDITLSYSNEAITFEATQALRKELRDGLQTNFAGFSSEIQNPTSDYFARLAYVKNFDDIVVNRSIKRALKSSFDVNSPSVFILRPDNAQGYSLQLELELIAANAEAEEQLAEQRDAVLFLVNVRKQHNISHELREQARDKRRLELNRRAALRAARIESIRIAAIYRTGMSQRRSANNTFSKVAAFKGRMEGILASSATNYLTQQTGFINFSEEYDDIIRTSISGESITFEADNNISRNNYIAIFGFTTILRVTADTARAVAKAAQLAVSAQLRRTPLFSITAARGAVIFALYKIAVDEEAAAQATEIMADREDLNQARLELLSISDEEGRDQAQVDADAIEAAVDATGENGSVDGEVLRRARLPSRYALFSGSNVSEDDHDEWDEDEEYSRGDFVISSVTHSIYRALVDNTDVNPDEEQVKLKSPLIENPDIISWQRTSATNRWKLFDNKPSILCENEDSINVDIITRGNRIGLGFFNLSAQSIEISVTEVNSLGESEVTLFETIELRDDTVVIDWLTYFTEEIQVKTNTLFLNLPLFRPNSQVSISIIQPDCIARCGQIVVGDIFDMGFAKVGRSGFNGLDFSRVDIDEFGNLDTTVRASSRITNVDVVVQTTQLQRFEREFKALRGGVSAVWIPDQDDKKGAFGYGFYRDYNVVYNTGGRSIIDLEIQGVV